MKEVRLSCICLIHLSLYSPCLTDCLRVSEFSRWFPFRLAIFGPISWATSSNEQMNNFNILVLVMYSWRILCAVRMCQVILVPCCHLVDAHVFGHLYPVLYTFLVLFSMPFLPRFLADFIQVAAQKLSVWPLLSRR